MARTRPPYVLGAALAAAALGVGPAAAHGVETAQGGVQFAIVVGLAVAAGVAAGLVAAARCRDTAGARPTVESVLGPLLALVGGAAVLAATGRSLLAASPAVVGIVATWVAVRRLGRGHVGRRTVRANTALGAVTAHRVLEGVSLAVVYATGSAVGAVGAVVLAGHATVETAAVGGLFGVTSRARAAAAVGVVQVAFVAGAAVGVLATAGLPPALNRAAVALVGGSLLVVGATETAAHARPDRLAGRA